MTGFIWNVEWNLFQQQCNIKAAVDFSIESETVEQRVSECMWITFSHLILCLVCWTAPVMNGSSNSLKTNVVENNCWASVYLFIGFFSPFPITLNASAKQIESNKLKCGKNSKNAINSDPKYRPFNDDDHDERIICGLGENVTK